MAGPADRPMLDSGDQLDIFLTDLIFVSTKPAAGHPVRAQAGEPHFPWVP